MRNSLKLAISMLWLGPVAAVAMPILNFDSNGQLLGASNVDVNGSFYNVEFANGNCAGLFGGCDMPTEDFTFTTQTAARAASAALLAQVFTDSAINGRGDFDSAPYLTAGCTATTLCGAMTPYQLGFGVNFYTAANSSNENMDRLFTLGTSFTGETRPDSVWAVWTAAAPTTVPEPSTLSLLALGLVRIGMGHRRERRQPDSA